MMYLIFYTASLSLVIVLIFLFLIFKTSRAFLFNFLFKLNLGLNKQQKYVKVTFFGLKIVFATFMSFNSKTYFFNVILQKNEKFICLIYYKILEKVKSNSKLHFTV